MILLIKSMNFPNGRNCNAQLKNKSNFIIKLPTCKEMRRIDGLKGSLIIKDKFDKLTVQPFQKVNPLKYSIGTEIDCVDKCKNININKAPSTGGKSERIKSHRALKSRECYLFGCTIERLPKGNYYNAIISPQNNPQTYYINIVPKNFSMNLHKKSNTVHSRIQIGRAHV